MVTRVCSTASADFNTFDLMQSLDSPGLSQTPVPKMACEKLVKAHRCVTGTPAEDLQSSHVGIAVHLPRVLRQQAVFLNFNGQKRG